MPAPVEAVADGVGARVPAAAADGVTAGVVADRHFFVVEEHCRDLQSVDLAHLCKMVVEGQGTAATLDGEGWKLCPPRPDSVAKEDATPTRPQAPVPLALTTALP